ncbi:MAG TPA: metallophosphoesterase [Xanthomonadales bacterium]|nr:metallophosphoesterase [Xanthomonadales bacterium]
MLGRDWVIGDVHGAFDLVEQALFAVRFRPDVDRLICVGDLVDRGNDSARVEQFLQQPYVHAVRGNHDHLVATTDPLVLQAMAISNHNGLRWIGDLSIPRVRRIQQALAELPYAIEIASADGTLPTGIVHAQVPQNWPWPDMVDALSDWPEEDALFDDVMKSRYKFDSQDAAAVHGVSRVFVGHCICWNGPRILGNTVFTDTGAVFTGQEEGASLSIIDLSASNAQIEAARMDDEHPGLRICRANSAFEFEFEFTDAPARDRRTAQRP